MLAFLETGMQEIIQFKRRVGVALSKKYMAVIVAVGVPLVGAIVWRSVAADKVSLPSDLRPEFTVSDEASGFARYSEVSVSSRLTDAFDQVAEEVSGIGGDPQLSYLLETRASLAFAPDFDQWLAHVHTALGSSRKDTEWFESIDDDFRAAWINSMKAYSNPLIDVANIRVEHVDPDRKKPIGQPGTIWLRNAANLSAPYFKQIDTGSTNDTREAIEVFVPVVVRDAQGEDLGATISFVLGRDRAGDDWRELEMFVYMGPSSFGRNLVMPPF